MNISTAIDPAALKHERDQYRSPNSEFGFLAAILRHPASILEVGDLRPEHFHAEPCGQIWRAMLEVARRSHQGGITPAIDVVNLLAVFESWGTRLPQNAIDTVRDVAQSGVVSESPVVLAQLIREDAARRWLYDAMRHWQVSLGARPVTDVLAEIGMVVGNLHGRLGTSQADDLSAALARVLDDPTARLRWHNPRFPQFFTGLGGLRPGSLTVLSGRSKAGKSMVLANLVLGFAEAGIPVLWLDTEMDAAEQAERLASILGQLWPNQLHEPQFAEQVSAARRRLPDLAPLIRFVRTTDLGAACGSIRQFAHDSRGTGVVIFDWLRPGLLGGGQRAEWQVLGEMASTLKDVAADVCLPIIAANQENRSAIGATHRDRLEGGERFGAGSDRITQFCSASCSIVPLGQDVLTLMRQKFPTEGGPLATHLLVTNVSRHGASRLLVPLQLSGLRLTEVNSPELVEWLGTVSPQPTTKRKTLTSAIAPKG